MLAGVYGFDTPSSPPSQLSRLVMRLQKSSYAAVVPDERRLRYVHSWQRAGQIVGGAIDFIWMCEDRAGHGWPLKSILVSSSPSLRARHDLVDAGGTDLALESLRIEGPDNRRDGDHPVDVLAVGDGHAGQPAERYWGASAWGLSCPQVETRSPG